MHKDGFSSVSSEQVALVQLSNELNVTKELVLSLEQILFMILHCVLLTGIIGLLLERLELVLLEDLLEAVTAVIKQLLSECAEFKVGNSGLLTLRLKLDMNDLGAQVAVELTVGVLGLGLTEDGLHDDGEHVLVDDKVRLSLLLEAFL